MNNKMISIIVPVYKVEKELDRCVQSLLHQTYSNIEIILVDDGSPDRCPELCDHYALQDNRVTVIHKQNGGLSDARNAGLDVAKGEFILYVDSDDYIEFDSCERLLKNVVEDVDIVVGACKQICKDIVTYQRHTNIIPGKIYTAREFVIMSIKNFEWYAPAWLNLYKRQFLIDNKLYYKKGYLYEDIQMLPRLFLSAKRVVYVDYSFYNYIIRENSIMTSENSPQKIKMTLDIYTDWYVLISEITDVEYQKYLYGYLIKLYLKSARVRKIKGWKVSHISALFALRYALGLREKLKVIFFTLAPSLYIH